MDSELRDIVFLGLKDVNGQFRPPWYSYILGALIVLVILALGIFLLIAAFNSETEVRHLLCLGLMNLLVGVFLISLVNSKIIITEDSIAFIYGFKKTKVIKTNILIMDVTRPKRGRPIPILCDHKVRKFPIYKSLMNALEISCGGNNT